MSSITVPPDDATFGGSKGKGSWYFISTFECPICGRGPTYRERREGPKPERYEDRHEYDPTAYDYCDAL